MNINGPKIYVCRESKPVAEEISKHQLRGDGGMGGGGGGEESALQEFFCKLDTIRSFLGPQVHDEVTANQNH